MALRHLIFKVCVVALVFFIFGMDFALAQDETTAAGATTAFQMTKSFVMYLPFLLFFGLYHFMPTARYRGNI